MEFRNHISTTCQLLQKLQSNTGLKVKGEPLDPVVAAVVAHQVDVHQGSHRLEKYFITDRGLCSKSS